MIFRHDFREFDILYDDLWLEQFKFSGQDLRAMAICSSKKYYSDQKVRIHVLQVVSCLEQKKGLFGPEGWDSRTTVFFCLEQKVLFRTESQKPS